MRTDGEISICESHIKFLERKTFQEILGDERDKEFKIFNLLDFICLKYDQIDSSQALNHVHFVFLNFDLTIHWHHIISIPISERLDVNPVINSNIVSYSPFVETTYTIRSIISKSLIWIQEKKTTHLSGFYNFYQNVYEPPILFYSGKCYCYDLYEFGYRFIDPLLSDINWKAGADHDLDVLYNRYQNHTRLVWHYYSDHLYLLVGPPETWKAESCHILLKVDLRTNSYVLATDLSEEMDVFMDKSVDVARMYDNYCLVQSEQSWILFTLDTIQFIGRFHLGLYGSNVESTNYDFVVFGGNIFISILEDDAIFGTVYHFGPMASAFQSYSPLAVNYNVSNSCISGNRMVILENTGNAKIEIELSLYGIIRVVDIKKMGCRDVSFCFH